MVLNFIDKFFYRSIELHSQEDTVFARPLEDIQKYLKSVLGSSAEVVVDYRGGIYTSLENVGFGCELVRLPLGRGGKFMLVPTISGFNLGSLKGKGHGSEIVTIWENSFTITDYPYLGASSVENPRFFRDRGYTISYESNFLLKHRG